MITELRFVAAKDGRARSRYKVDPRVDADFVALHRPKTGWVLLLPSFIDVETEVTRRIDALAATLQQHEVLLVQRTVVDEPRDEQGHVRSTVTLRYVRLAQDAPMPAGMWTAYHAPRKGPVP